MTGTSVPLPDGGARAERQASPEARRAAGDDTRFTVVAPSGIGEISPGDDLARIVGDALAREGGLHDGDVVVVTSKVVSKAEGRVVATRPSPGGVLRIVENRLGLVMAAAGVDASNTPEGTVLLLPVDPDASARALRAALAERFGVRVGVVVSDTAGRAWREGLTDLAIGVAGVVALDDLRGGVDSHGRELSVTVTAVADQIAAASELVRGKAAGRPVAVVRGLGRFVTDAAGPGARVLVRNSGTDMFREGSAEAYARGVAAGRAGAAGEDWSGVGTPGGAAAPRTQRSRRHRTGPGIRRIPGKK